MKTIDKLIPAISYNSIEVNENILKSKNIYKKIIKLNKDLSDINEEITSLSKECKNILSSLGTDINTFKTILNKFNTCYLGYLYLSSDNTNYKQLSILDFKEVYTNDYNLEKYANEHIKKFEFKQISEYKLSQDINNVSIIDENILMKHVYKKVGKSYTMSLHSILQILCEDYGYFINKKEFNKHYELID